MVASHECASLFTNTPIDKALNIIRERLELDSALKDSANLKVDDIMEVKSNSVVRISFDSHILLVQGGYTICISGEIRYGQGAPFLLL